MEIHVYHGPNLQSLSDRDRSHYGDVQLEGINDELRDVSDSLSIDITIRQTNHEGDLVDWINEASIDGLVLNPGGYTHTSVAIRDAVSLSDFPVVEVHLSNIHSRDDFRRESMIAPACIGQISGFGADSYKLGLRAVVNNLQS